jgi:hypothetical protein
MAIPARPAQGRKTIKRGQGGRIVEGKSFRLADEVRYIQRRAADYDSRIVTIGQLLNPLGIKSVGEGGINGVGAVIAAAIDEAVGLPGAVTRLPATPQPIKALLRAAAQRGRPAAVEG